ncbi:hypothetical protein [Nonomuraea sp. NPDC050202]|uniref:hypothetical protein n=1 Tax=Nonomuraea sp. NPDC050202 TaxID=3155035 RepID=UPI0033E34FDF
MQNGKIAPVIPITAAAPRTDFGTFTATDGSTIQVVHVGDKVKLRVQSKVGVGDDVTDVVLYLDYDAQTGLDLHGAIGLAAVTAKGFEKIMKSV